MSAIPELLNTSKLESLSVNDLIVAMYQHADKAETHVAFQGTVSEYVTLPPRVRTLADGLGKARDAAARGDKESLAEQKALMAEARQVLWLNAHHVVMLSLHRNDPNLLLNAGYEPKQKGKTKTVANLLDLVPKVSPKHGPASGCVTVQVQRAKTAASVELQMTDHDPNDESSWSSQGMYSKSRFEIRGLTPATRVYFRSRYHLNGGTGRWSAPVELIVL